MARHKLRDTQIKGLPAGRHGDGDGLWLYVNKTGTRSWVFIFIRQGIRREVGLGSYGNVSGKISLADARRRADEAREIVKNGGDPRKDMAHRRRMVKLRTFGECADELLISKENTFRNEKHAAQWKMTLTEYAQPLRKIPVGDVTTDDVVRVLRPLWTEKQETASRLRGRIEKVLDYAKAVGLRSGENPARWKGHLDHILPARQKLAKGHHAAMPYADVPAFMVELVGVDGFGARALELCILTATRSGEVLNAEWSEFDLDKALWTIPAERMKMAREHIVPLSDRALGVLQGLQAKRLSNYVFPGVAPKRPLSNMAMTAVMRRMKKGDLTVHGFRSSFRDWAGDATNFPRDVAEMALAHKVGDETEQAYRRGSALAKRRKLMDAWSAYVSTVKGGENVLALAGKR
ncbi:integrase arm-type DNA-binding domain-containing protein [Mesorhizobium sp. WSM4976]|uniref:tyrosine-type recombinase/integrase n=1 Tax=Mesorhizobium sp. WSM4976 TaxID=3038549 RepID=UPI002417CDC9|nr:site-specific integrase [Mesorhizobium sp. WSM4976]MDG4898059.1 integrase arm-type DNA-binding domain-containing protein [Mesorhizobium sp. WSM4976]